MISRSMEKMCGCVVGLGKERMENTMSLGKSNEIVHRKDYSGNER